MRSFRALSLLQTTFPDFFKIFSFIIILGGILVYLSLQYSHIKGLKKIIRNGIILVAAGVLIILLGYALSLNAMKYTHDSEKATAQVIHKESRHYSRHKRLYTFTVKFTYNEKVVSAELKSYHRTGINNGDYIDIYFYPEESDSDYSPIIVAVDEELEYANKHIISGTISCIAGLLLIILAKVKEKQLSDGFHTSARIIQKSVSASKVKFSNDKTEWILICNGKHPATGMMQTFKTRGTYYDFANLEQGDTVHVFISKDFNNLYVINI